MPASQVLAQRLPSGSLSTRLGGGLLDSYVPAAVLGALAVLVAVGVVLAVRRRRARGRRAWPTVVAGALAVVLLGLLAVGGGVNAYVGYAPTLGALGELVGLPASDRSTTAPDLGRVTSFLVGDPALAVPLSRTWVYLPPGYDQHPEQRYPVVYLVHGYPGRSQDWIRAAQLPRQLDRLVSAGDLPPMIVVAPDMNGGWLHDSECLDAVNGPQLTTYLVRDVVPRVDATLRTLPRRGDRALGGMSSGGYCALDVGLHHLGVFGVLLAFEPYGDPGRNAIAGVLAGSRARYRAHSPSAYLPRMRFRHPVAVFLDEGSLATTAVGRVRVLADQLAARGQQVEYRVEPGQRHTWHEVRAGLPYALQFFARHRSAERAGPVTAARAPVPSASAGPPTSRARRPAAAPSPPLRRPGAARPSAPPPRG